MVWIITFIGALITYLLSSGKPPTQWAYGEWLQAGAFVVATLSAKLQGSPLQLSFKGQEKIARGESVFVEMPKQEEQKPSFPGEPLRTTKPDFNPPGRDK
jgi:hypothetical protein